MIIYSNLHHEYCREQTVKQYLFDVQGPPLIDFLKWIKLADSVLHE